MRKLIFAAAAVSMVVAASPAFASAAGDAEWGISTYPPVGQCHFVKQAVTMSNGHVVYQDVQVCN